MSIGDYDCWVSNGGFPFTLQEPGFKSNSKPPIQTTHWGDLGLVLLWPIQQRSSPARFGLLAFGGPNKQAASVRREQRPLQAVTCDCSQELVTS